MSEAAQREKALRKHAMKMAIVQTVSDARAFAEYDGDGNARLDFDEVRNSVRTRDPQLPCGLLLTVCTSNLDG